MNVFCKLCFVFLHIKLSPKYQLAEKLPFAEQMIFSQQLLDSFHSCHFFKEQITANIPKSKAFLLDLYQHCVWNDGNFQSLLPTMEEFLISNLYCFIAYDSVWVRVHHFHSAPLCPSLKRVIKSHRPGQLSWYLKVPFLSDPRVIFPGSFLPRSCVNSWAAAEGAPAASTRGFFPWTLKGLNPGEPGPSPCPCTWLARGACPHCRLSGQEGDAVSVLPHWGRRRRWSFFAQLHDRVLRLLRFS